MPPLYRRTLIMKFNSNARFPKTDAILNSAIYLPIYPSLSDEEAEYVVDAFNKVVN